MLLDLLTSLSSMLTSSISIAVAGSFLWGIASILLSPCHLSSIPLIVGYIDSQGNITTSRAATISAMFSGGILITISVIGVITGFAGRMIGDIGQYGNITVSIFMVIIGLYLADIIPLAFLDNGINQPGMKRKGLLAAFLLGLFFGLALGPCTFAYMAPMLGIVFTVASTNLIYAVILIGAYAVGHCAVIIIAGSSAEIVNRVLKLNETSAGMKFTKKMCGFLVIVAGLYMFYNSIKTF